MSLERIFSTSHIVYSIRTSTLHSNIYYSTTEKKETKHISIATSQERTMDLFNDDIIIIY